MSPYHEYVYPAHFRPCSNHHQASPHQTLNKICALVVREESPQKSMMSSSVVHTSCVKIAETREPVLNTYGQREEQLDNKKTLSKIYHVQKSCCWELLFAIMADKLHGGGGKVSRSSMKVCRKFSSL